MRLRYAVIVNPSHAEVRGTSAKTQVVFAPMEALGEGLGGLDTSMSRLFGDVINGSYNYFAKGDILLAKVTPCFENGKKALVEDMPLEMGFATSEVHVIRPNPGKIDSRYLLYLFSSEAFRAFGVSTMTGASGLRRVPEETILNYRLPIVELSAQRRIADILDRETAKIDELIGKKARLLRTLKEKRQAEIDRLLTNGLDLGSPMRLSSVSWANEIPGHWRLVAIKRVAKIRYGIGEPPVYRSEGVPLIRATNVRSGKLDFKGIVFVNPDDIPKTRITWLTPGDIIVVRSGAYTGDSALIREDDCPAIAGFDMVLRSREVDPEYLQYALLASYVKESQIGLEKLRAAQPHLNAEELGSCRIFLPPSCEQKRIVKVLDAEIARLVRIHEKTADSINKLHELRSALITAAVTGQLDMDSLEPREWSGATLGN